MINLNKMNKIYTVTCIHYKNDRSDTYCVGWFSSFEKAENLIINNIGDIFEYYYTYALIESVHEGHAKYEKLAWYEPVWGENGEGVLSVNKIPEPEPFKQIINFSMG